MKIAIDTETDSTDPRTARLAYISTYDGEGEVRVYNVRGNPVPDFRMAPVGHNISYDMLVLGDHLRCTALPHDTMIKAWEKDSDDLSLKGLSTRLLGVPVIGFRDVVPNRKQTIFDVEPGVAGRYAAQDAYITRRLDDALILDSRESSLYESIDRPLLPILVRCTQRGMDTDVEAATKMYTDYDERLATIRERIRAISGCENPASSQQLVQAFTRLGVSLPRRRTATGKQALDVEVLKLIQHPLASLVLYHRDLSYRQSHFIKPMMAGHMSFLYKITGTETGRISTEKPNGQNFPEMMRRLYKARKGYKFVISDYSGAEMVIAAEASGDKNLTEMFMAGRSPHKEMAVRLYGENYTPTQYVQTKSGNFEVLYGGGEAKLAEVTGCSREEAARIFDMNREMYPELNAYLTESVRRAYRNGYAETLHGRRRGIPALYDERAEMRSHGERQAKNTPIQGTAGDLTKRAMVLYSNYRDDIIHQQHDEIVVECREGEEEKAKECLEASMIAAAREVITHVPMRVETYISDVWSKGK